MFTYVTTAPMTRVRPVFGGKAGSVAAPQNFVIDVSALAAAKSFVNTALLHRKRRSIRQGMVNEGVHILTQQVLGPLISQELKARGVTEGAVALQVDAVDRFRDGVDQFSNFFFRGFALGDINQRCVENPIGHGIVLR